MSNLTAVDIDTGKILSPEAAEKAAANPMIYTWVRWVEAPVAPASVTA